VGEATPEVVGEPTADMQQKEKEKEKEQEQEQEEAHDDAAEACSSADHAEAAAVIAAASSSRGFCPSHKGWNLSFYCMQCYTFVCAQCVYNGEHLGHKFKPMMKAIEVVKTTFEQKLRVLADRRSRMREFAEALPGTLPTLTEEKDRAINVIRNRLDVLRACLRNRQYSMKQDLGKLETERLDRLQLEMFRLQSQEIKQLERRRTVIQEAIDQPNMYQFFQQQHPEALLQISPPVPPPAPLREFGEIAAEAAIPMTIHNDKQLIYLSQMKANITSNIQASFAVGEKVVVLYDREQYEGTVADAEYRVDECVNPIPTALLTL